MSAERKIYRRAPDDALWHFCKNCSQWPAQGQTIGSFPHLQSQDLCSECLRLEARGLCE